MEILAALPSVRTPIVNRKGELRPARPLSEPLRRLHASLQLEGTRNGQARAPRSILFVSAEAGDGKSTVAAGLALVQREAERRVVVMEADFRRPVMAKLLDVGHAHGLADVLAGTLPLDAAMQQVERVSPAVSIDDAGSPAGATATAVRTAEVGSLSVLVGGTNVANPPALLARPAMAELLGSLADEYDHVLVDAPPPLQVSDVLPLLTLVDGIVVVARAGHTRRASARRLTEMLARTSSAPLLGVVANAVSSKDMDRYGFSSGYGTQRRWPRSMIGR